ncbi:Dipeptidyl aminopeptidase/acylaminoacyl peptidase [Lutibacter flavus]|uniref:Dipeptidyl aminopeptidase/acylaminoacyl peptidase n=2 Tax=Lutibacter flavus TaxID=691689 RepID=A0A238VJ60_9FLAO|nr:Dipeptidyl aminopeptidase/acylaminoacyl peptidase [Lutibacter flavus]
MLSKKNPTMKIFLTTLLIFISLSIFAQKKILDHKDLEIWNTIKNKTISSNGEFIMYSLEKGEKDSWLKIKNGTGGLVFEHERSEKGQFTYHSKYALFTLKPWKDSIKELKRSKVKKDDLPKDTLGIYNLNTKSLHKLGNVKSYKTPEKWSGFIAYLLEDIKSVKKEEDTLKPKKKDKKKSGQKVGKENGYHLVLRDLNNTKQDTFKFVTDYVFAEEAKRLAFITSGVDSTVKAGVYVLNLENNNLAQIFDAEKATYSQLNFSETGKNLGFVVDTDTTKVLVRPNQLFHWKEGAIKAQKVLDENNAPNGFRVSSDGKISFSKDESKLYFGLSKPPIVKDTTLLDEEIVNVEVWTYDEPRLYTVQELQVKSDVKKSYLAAIHLNNSNKLIQIGSLAYPDARLGNEGNSELALVSTSLPYELESQWTGNRARDYAIVNTNTGEITKILTKMSGRINISPAGKYAYGYNSVDSTWFAYSLIKKKMTNLTKGEVFYNELNDSPNNPYAYGSLGWSENDASLLIYNRFDIWKFNPDTGLKTKLTNGRENKTVYRYVKLDKEERFVNDKKWILKTFNEVTKNSGYYEFNSKNNTGKQLITGPFSFSTPLKARENNKVIYTKESFIDFPDIIASDLSFKKQNQLSNANPQQKEYNWGTAELVNWTSLDGVELTGMLIKPENFDPSKKYPMIVNFYEKSSDGLFRHKAPSAGRSTINYSFYASRGYLIFNPDINYRIGYPGESALNCVLPGVTSLIDKGFVDKDNIGVQGHSWGGYQIAYLVTKTDIFKAAESGAPVPNMISAYGGIRWWTGLSRQFQYEHTQSRIGGTPWEYPQRYIENSPIFNIDKINTPLLIMHNDADGHVPWYQGIEFFTALRRLGKPSWFLNYNGEPHWPQKIQNRKDFNIRLAQFFDFYLKGAQKPVWMKRGVPAIEKGINQGLELLPVGE